MILTILKRIFAAPEPVYVPPAPVMPEGEITFDVAFDRLIGHEGKFQNDREDRGNWTSGRVGVGENKGTKYGISAMTYPHLDILNLTLDEARAIYERDYWERSGADEYDGAIGYQVFDAAVNHGIENAVRFLQRAARVADDGHIGPITLAAIKKMTVTDVLMRFNAARLRFYRKLSNWSTYGRGWVARIADNLDYGAEDA